MKTFGIGDKVKWVSQAQGCPVKKVGRVVEVVQPGELPSAPPDGCGGVRKAVSYVITVPGKTPKALARLYWPVASRLSAAKSDAAMGKWRRFGVGSRSEPV